MSPMSAQQVLKCLRAAGYIWLEHGIFGFHATYRKDVEMVTVKLLVDGDVPDVVDSRWCADTFGITPAAVQAAIHDGRISATRFGRLWALKSEDAMRVWGHRLIRNKT